MTRDGYVKKHMLGILFWKKWKKGASMLWISSSRNDVDALQETELLSYLKDFIDEINVVPIEAFTEIYGSDADEIKAMDEKYDYVISLAGIERTRSPSAFLKKCRKTLREGGQLLFSADNRIGIRYFCGQRDPYSGGIHDGVSNYAHVHVKREQTGGRCYAQSELRRFLEAAGWKKFRFYSLFPDDHYVQHICSSDHHDQTIASCLPPDFVPDTLFLDYLDIMGTLVSNGIYHQMANNYLVECSLGREDGDILQYSKLELDRDVTSTVTSIYRDRETKELYVEKRMPKWGNPSVLELLHDNTENLAKKGIPVVPHTFADGLYRMPYIYGERGLEYFARVRNENVEKFLKQADKFVNYILQSSEMQMADGKKIMKTCYLEMIPQNCFVVDDDFIFFDQSSCRRNFPLERLIFRFIFFTSNQYTVPSIADLAKRYGIEDRLDELKKQEREGTLFTAGPITQTITIKIKEQPMYYEKEKIRQFRDVAEMNHKRFRFGSADSGRDEE